MTSGRGIQVTTGTSGANGMSPIDFINVSQVIVTYSTNASKGAGSIAVQIGSNNANSQSVTKSGGTTDRTLTYNFSPNQTGKVKVTVTCTTNSIYVKSITIITESGSSTTTYTVTYNANGGTGTISDLNSPYSSGSSVTVLENTFTRDGYTFNHWDTKADDSGIDYVAGNTFTISGNTTLYAQWEEELEEEEFVLHMGDITDDDYIIYYNGKAMNTILDGNRLQYENVTPINYEIITDNKSIIWHISKIPETDYYTIYNVHERKYVASTNSQNQATLLDNITDNAKWVIEIINNKTYEFKNLVYLETDHNKLRNNSSYGFARYADATGGSLTLYRKYSGTESHIVQWMVNNELYDIQTVNNGLHVPYIPTVDVNNYCGDTIVGWITTKYFSNTLPNIFSTSEESPIIRKDTVFYAVFTSYDNTFEETYHRVNLDDLTDDDIFIIIAKYNDTYYALSNDNEASSAPSGVMITPICDFIFTDKTNILWNIEKTDNNYIFYINGDNTKWLYCTNTNNGVRVGTNNNKLFIVNNSYLYNIGTSRYIGVYRTNPDWRCYTTINENILNQTFEFYKRVQNITDFHTACMREFNDTQTDGLWTTKENWTNNKIPTLKYTAQINKPVVVDTAHAVAKNIVVNQNDGTGKITIQPNKGLEVDSTIVVYKENSYTSTTPSNLILESSEAGNASLIFNNNNNSQATVCLYSKAYKNNDICYYQYIGTNMTELNALYNYYGSWIYKWNGQKWKSVPNGGTMYAWNGYCITQENPICYATTGMLVPTDGNDITLEVPANSNMVFANSWTAPIHISKFTNETFKLDTMNIYLFNTGSDPEGDGAVGNYELTEPGTYVVIPIYSSPYTGDSLIAPQQGFYVKTGEHTGGTITLKYNELVRTNGQSNIVAGTMRAPKHHTNNNPDIMKIYANGSKYQDKVVILERSDFSIGFDNGWDGEKAVLNKISPSIYVINENNKYDAVSAIPNYEGIIIGFKPGTDTIYNLSFEYNGDNIWYLNDIKEQKSV